MPSGGHNKIELTADLREQIIDGLMNGQSLAGAAKSIGISRSTIDRWRSVNKEFADEVLRAVHIGFDARCDRLNEVAEKMPDVNRAKLWCDNEKWALERQAPHRYGNKLDLTVNQTVDIGPLLAEARSRLLPDSYPKEEHEVKSEVITQAKENQATGSEPVKPGDDGSDLLS